ncbi:hypothetical protein SAMN05216302_10276 [Nitrosomonas aestuarii]|uniref:Uncharacterized protein n=1 Tax=Nitrosomonas aestuarii TaxID=52441 RepID=A0A1I4EAG3_9PROT|nr:hypothetical protein [Nitrosomonas aestuarii]SFL02778.1 hypothetical protein SAMN05216302_10276 [Nitrosomonas aestuarii]
MGRYIDSSNSDELVITGSSVVGRAVAAEAIEKNDLINTAPNGKAYPVVVTDYAAVPNKGSTVIAETEVINGNSFAYSRYAVFRDPNTGNLFFVAPHASGNPGAGCRVYKYSPNGGLIGSVRASDSGGLLYNPKIKQLSDGNLVITWAPSETTDIAFFIIDKDLNIIKDHTIIDANPLYGSYGMDVLSGGGFFCSYTQVGNTQRVIVYDNDGDVVTGSTSIKTWTGTAAGVTTNVGQLSNGNVAVVCTSMYSTSKGTFLGIYNTAGAQVLAIASVDAAAWSGTVIPEIVSVSGFFVVAHARAATTVVLRVYNNAGALQGSELTFTTPSSGASLNTFRLIDDASKFYLITQSSSVLKFNISTVSTAGDLLLQKETGSFTTAGPVLAIDAFIEGDYLVAMHNNIGTGTGGTQWSYFVVGADDLLVKTQTIAFSTTATTGGIYGKIIPCSDFAFTAFFNFVSPQTSSFFIGKYADTAIAGVAENDASIGEVVSINQGAGNSNINAVFGSSPKTFDMSVSNIRGNKGTAMNNGVVLEGI